MAETTSIRSSIFSFFPKLIPILALAVGVVSLVLTVAARKKEITCEYTGNTRLVAVNSSGLPSEVRMEYRGEPVSTLNKLSFKIANSGAAAIKKEDVREPLKLTFPSTVRVLSAATDRTSPQDLRFQPTLDTDGRTVNLEFSLLNSGDEAAFSVYIINSEPASPEFRGRVVDVPRLVFISKTTDENVGPALSNVSNHAVRRILRWVVVGVQSFIALVFIAAMVSALRDHKRKPSNDQITSSIVVPVTIVVICVGLCGVFVFSAYLSYLMLRG